MHYIFSVYAGLFRWFHVFVVSLQIETMRLHYEITFQFMQDWLGSATAFQPPHLFWTSHCAIVW